MPTPTRLLNRDFLLLWQGQSISGIGVSLFQIAGLYWLLETTGSATTMGLVSMVAAIPGVLLGPFGGAIADRYSRRLLIVVGDAVLGVTILTIGVVFWFVEGQVELKIGLLIVAGVLSGIVNAFFRPAVMAAVPNLVPLERLQAANAMNSFSMSASMALGQAIGGVLFRILGAPFLILANGVTYLLSALSEVFIRMPQELPEAPPALSGLARAFWRDVLDGLRYVWAHKGLRNLVIAFAVLNFVSAPLMILLPILVDRHLELPPDWYGYLMGALAAGNLFGMAVVGALRIDGKRRLTWGLAALYTMSLTTLALGITESTTVLLAIHVVSGFFMGGINVLFPTLLQATTPDELRGRVMSVMMTVMNGTAPISMGLAGVIADLANQNVPLIFVTIAGIVAVLVTGLAVNGPFREFMSTRLEGMTVASAPDAGSPRFRPANDVSKD